MLKEKNLRLRAIDKSDLRFLFKLLKERDPKANISHKKMPTYVEHSKFVLSKPYSKWYIIFLRNKKIVLAIDIGANPKRNFSKDYQSGALSFEIISSGKKLITNSGYFVNKHNKLNKISKSTALHNTLIIEDYSSCAFKKIKKLNFVTNQDLKISKKNIQ